MLRAIRWIVGAGFVTAGMVLAGATTQAQDPKPGVGDPFPNIPVPATQIDLVKKGGKELSIQDLKGKIVVVAFYPKALTGGWTIECNGFRDLLKEFPAGTVVLGASADPVALNQKFTDKEKYTFPLLSDVDKKLITALGIKSASGNAMRVTYVVDRDGKIAKIYPKVAPKGHAEEVLKFVKTLDKK